MKKNPLNSGIRTETPRDPACGQRASLHPRNSLNDRPHGAPGAQPTRPPKLAPAPPPTHSGCGPAAPAPPQSLTWSGGQPKYSSTRLRRSSTSAMAAAPAAGRKGEVTAPRRQGQGARQRHSGLTRSSRRSPSSAGADSGQRRARTPPLFRPRPTGAKGGPQPARADSTSQEQGLDRKEIRPIGSRRAQRRANERARVGGPRGGCREGGTFECRRYARRVLWEARPASA